MHSKLNPYITFKGNALEAMEFYKTVFGGELTSSTFKEGGMEHDKALEDQIIHAELVAKDTITLMASDAQSIHDLKDGNNISLSLSGDNKEELTDYFNKLAEGGKITEPLVAAPWGDLFGMLTDKFGITWLVNIATSTEEKK